MATFFSKIDRYIELLNKAVEAICNVLLVVMVLIIIAQVCFRYVLSSPISWSEEVALFILIWFGLLSVATAIYRNGHMSITFIWDRLSLRGQHILDAIVELLILSFSLNIMLNSSLLVALVGSEVLPASGILRSYLYLAPVVSGALMTINSISNLVLGYNIHKSSSTSSQTFMGIDK